VRRTLFRTVVGVLILGCGGSLAAKTVREIAAERYKKAQVLLEDIESVPSVELGEPQYLLVIDALKSVHRATPASSYCDDALLAVGDVYAAMVGRFGPDPWKRKAVEAYEYAIHEYPHSKLLGKARDAIAGLESGAKTTLGQARRAADPEDEAEERDAGKAPADAIVRPASTTSAPGGGTKENHAAPSPESMNGGVATISSIRHYSYPDYTRIVIDADDYAPYKFDFLSRPSRMYFDLLSAKLADDIRLGVDIEVGDPQVSRVRAAQNRVNKARVVLDLADEVTYDISWIANPPRLVIDLRGQHASRQVLARNDSPAAHAEPPPAPAGVAAKPAPEPEKPQSFQEAFLALTAGRKSDQPAPVDLPERQPELTREPERPVEPVREPQPQVILAKAVVPADHPSLPDNLPPPKPAEATSRGNQSLIRALGLKIGRVVIDAGHGGHDTGMIGPTGLREKDVVLDVALRLGKLIETKLGAEVVHTRDDDSFLELSDRPKVANNAKADLFVSVHANAYSSASVRGVETFYLNFTADPWALKVASRENAASSHTVHELQDLLGKIAQKEKMDESREFALKMQSAVHAGLSKETAGLKNRGVRQAPLIVLIGAKMPAILTEIGFLSNPTDEKLFKSGAYRDKVAEQLFSGIESYMRTLSSHSLTMSDKDSAAASLD
jgi:N-acetylmuramoyl-L-alanine amidase